LINLGYVALTLVVGMLHHPLLGNKYLFTWVPGVPTQLPAEIRINLEGKYGILDGTVIRPAAQPDARA